MSVVPIVGVSVAVAFIASVCVNFNANQVVHSCYMQGKEKNKTHSNMNDYLFKIVFFNFLCDLFKTRDSFVMANNKE